MKKTQQKDDFAAQVGRALRRAAKAARRIAAFHGTPVYIMRHGKIVAEKCGKPGKRARRTAQR